MYHVDMGVGVGQGVVWVGVMGMRVGVCMMRVLVMAGMRVVGQVAVSLGHRVWMERGMRVVVVRVSVVRVVVWLARCWRRRVPRWVV